MFKKKMRNMRPLAGVLAGIFAVMTAFGQSDQRQLASGNNQPAQPMVAASSPPPAPHPKSRISSLATRTSKHADDFYRSVWGVEKMEVREAASGVLLRFSYRVTDINRALALNDKKSTPYLIDQKTGAVLQVPTMPKVGMLRQTGTPVKDLDYWMVFSNKGNFVKPGDRVDVVIGNFRAQGLVVQ